MITKKPLSYFVRVILENYSNETLFNVLKSVLQTEPFKYGNYVYFEKFFTKEEYDFENFILLKKLLQPFKKKCKIKLLFINLDEKTRIIAGESEL